MSPSQKEQHLNILLVNSNITRCARAGYGPTPAPGGLISLAGVLRRCGHQVRICQAHSHVSAQDEESLPLVVEEVRSLLAGSSPDLVGISVRNLGAARRPHNPFRLIQYYSAFYDARLVRAFRLVCKAPIVVGGTAFSMDPRLYLRYVRPDYGIIGEGEQALSALAEAIAGGRTPQDIPGLVRDPAEADTTLACLKRIEDLASVGIGACDAVEDFRNLYYEPGGFAPIQTKRGCPMNCIYCTTPFIEGTRYRLKPLANVIEEMGAYKRVWGVKHFFFTDATFNHPLDHAKELCDAILAAGLDIQWFSQLTPACLDDELCLLMVRSGCTGVTLTPDSCSDAVLESYGKGFTTAEVLRSVELLHSHSIPFDVCLIVGGPGETPGTFEESIEFCSRHLRNDVVRFYDGMVITPRSKVYARAVSEGLVDSSKAYDDVVLQNDFRAMKKYEYYFPHVRENRDRLLSRVDQACRGPRWILTSKDYAMDPATGELGFHSDIQIDRMNRPWWRTLKRISSC